MTSDEDAPTIADVADDKLWTADELLAMSPAERDAVVRAGFVTDIDQVPPDLLERARADIRAHIAETEARDAERR